MKKISTIEKYSFDSWDEVKEAVNNHKIVKAEVVVNDEVIADFDIVPEDDEKPVSEDNPLTLCYNYAEIGDVLLENVYMLKYL